MTPHDMLDEFLLTVVRRKWLILLTFVVCMAGLCGYLYIKYPLHKATVLILVHENPREQPTLFHDIVIPRGLNLRSNPTMNLIQISHSTDLARQIVNEHGLVDRMQQRSEHPRGPREIFWWSVDFAISLPFELLELVGILEDRGPTYENDAIHELLDDRQDVKYIVDSELISFSIWEEDPTVAMNMANRYADLLVKKTIEMSQSKTSVAYSITKELADESGVSYRKVESELANTKNEQNLVALETQQQQLLNRIDRAQAGYDGAVEQQETRRCRLAELREHLKGVPETIPAATMVTTNPLIKEIELAQHLTEMELASRELAAGDENPDVLSLRAKLDKADDTIQGKEPTIVASETTTVNSLHQELTSKIVDAEIELKTSASRAKTLQSQIASLQEELRTLASKEVMLSQLERDKKTHEEVYTNLTNKLAKLELEQLNRLGEFDIRIVDDAYLPSNKRKDWPKWKWYLIIGLPVSLIVGVLVACLVNYFDETFVTTYQLERQLAVPVLGCVPKVRKSKLAIRQ